MRDEMPSFEKTLRRWASIVRGERNSWAATSLFERPSATSRATCSSCGVRRSGAPSFAFAGGLARRPQLGPGAFCPWLGSQALERFERCAQGGAGVDPAPFAAQVLAVEQLGAGEVEGQRVGAPRERGLVVRGGRGPLAQQRSSGRQAHESCRRRPQRPLLQHGQDLLGTLASPRPHGGLDSRPAASRRGRIELARMALQMCVQARMCLLPMRAAEIQ